MKHSVEVIGSTKKLREAVKEASYFFLKSLLPRHHIFLRVELIRTLEKTEGIIGDTIWDDHNYRPREFVIRLDSAINFHDMIWTLAHEMIHLKQYAKGELYDYSHSPYTKWKGEKVDSNKYEYRELPWEIEAYKMDRPLYESLLNQTEFLYK